MSFYIFWIFKIKFYKPISLFLLKKLSSVSKFIYAIFSLKSDKPLSKIETILKFSCLGRLPTKVCIPAGDMTVIKSPISTFKLKLNSLPIEIALSFKFFDPKNSLFFTI